MTNFNLTLTLTEDAPIEDSCDSINELGRGDIRATWTENEDGVFEVKIQGSTDADEYTYNQTLDLIDDEINKLKEFAAPIPDRFLAVVLGGYSLAD